MVVYHSDATRAGLAYLALVGLKFLLRRGFGKGGFTCPLGLLHALVRVGSLAPLGCSTLCVNSGIYASVLKVIHCQNNDTRNDHDDTDHAI